MGRPLEDLILPPARRQEMVEAIEEWFEQGQVAASGERVLCDAEGKVVPVFSSHVLLTKGKAVPVFSSHVLLTKGSGEQELYCIDIDLGNVKSAFEEITGYTAAEILDRDPTLLESPATPPERYNEIWQTLREGHAWKGELESRRKNGERYWEFAYYAPVVDHSGEIRHCSAFCTRLISTP